MNNDNESKKRQAEVFKEGLELQKEINDSVKDVNTDIYHIDHALLNNDVKQMRDCAIFIKNKYPNFLSFLPPQVCLIIPMKIPLEFMSYEQLHIVLIAEINALKNMISEYGISQSIKKGLELAMKWRLEDLTKK